MRPRSINSWKRLGGRFGIRLIFCVCMGVFVWGAADISPMKLLEPRMAHASPRIGRSSGILTDLVHEQITNDARGHGRILTVRQAVRGNLCQGSERSIVLRLETFTVPEK
jgi:hypothetical protein